MGSLIFVNFQVADHKGFQCNHHKSGPVTHIARAVDGNALNCYFLIQQIGHPCHPFPPCPLAIVGTFAGHQKGHSNQEARERVKKWSMKKSLIENRFLFANIITNGYPLTCLSVFEFHFTATSCSGGRGVVWEIKPRGVLEHRDFPGKASIFISVMYAAESGAHTSGGKLYGVWLCVYLCGNGV